MIDDFKYKPSIIFVLNNCFKTLFLLFFDKFSLNVFYRYTDFREPPTSQQKYDLKNMFYIILACRLGFVVVFEVSFSNKKFLLLL